MDGVSFNIRPGTIFGLVGESGSGKTTVGRTLLGLYEKSAGSVKFHGQELADLTAPALRAIRPRMQLVFQDPYSSLNPRLRIGEAIGEAMLEHKLCARNELYDRVIDVMKICGLAPEHYARFPHQFSGGQRQRIGIARALILNRILSSPMNPSRPLMCRFRRRSSICFPTCATTAASRFCLSPTTSGWWSIYVTMWR